jgi:hypothetical protein|tara:strand:- start:294 stop:539 length:246 start_codon:yes stop_codon:yes gene_type:complete
MEESKGGNLKLMLLAINDTKRIIIIGYTKFNSSFLVLSKQTNNTTRHAINTDITPVRLLVSISDNIGSIDKKYHLLLFLAK